MGMGKAEVLNSPLTPSDHILVKRAYHLAGCENEDERYGGEYVGSNHLKRRCLKWGDNESESVEMGVNRGESGFLCNGFSPLTELGVCKRPGMKRQRSEDRPKMEAGGLIVTHEQMNSTLRELSRKEEECAQLRQQADLATKQNERLQEDNRMLKRGVAIQYQRGKDMESQLAELQRQSETVGEYVKRLEHVNYALSVRVEQMGRATHSASSPVFGEGSMGPRDVF